MKMKPYLFAALLAAASAHAQGIIQFTWHGEQNLFQASFQVWDYQVPVSGPFPVNFEGPDFSMGYYQDSLFDRTFTITAPDAYFPPGTCYGTGGSPLHNGFDEAGHLILGVHSPEPFSQVPHFASASQGYIGDGINQSWTYGESGHWSWAPIPEPSAFALLGLGLLALYMKKTARL
jgi:hypothetical protein